MTRKITLHNNTFRVVDARVHYTILKPLPNTTHHTTTLRLLHRVRVGPVG